MKYKDIFFDLDRTLWDFDTSAMITFQEIFEKYKLDELGVDSLEEFHRIYNLHNDELWALYRVGKIEKEVLRGLRFKVTLKDFGIQDDELAENIGRDYVTLSPLRVSLFPNAFQIMDYLSPKYKLNLITNGFSEVQATKLKQSGLGRYFLKVITSEEAGYKKPDKRIFSYAFEKTGASPETSLMIGDDPDVDIIGAKQVGMDQVLFDPKQSFSQNGSTYYVSDLIDLKRFL